MKPTTIFSANALAATTMVASAHLNIHVVAGLIERAIDPATMDPTKLSVLSVLKTAMPTPIGADIILPTGDARPQWYKDLPPDVMVLLAQMYPAAPTTAVSEISSAITNATSYLAQETLAASQTTLTKTLESGPTAAANTELSTGSPNRVSVNSTLPTGSPSPTQSSFSTGAKTATGTGKWSAIVGLCVAVCFFAFS